MNTNEIQHLKSECPPLDFFFANYGYIFTKILSNEKLVLLSDFAIFSYMNGNIISEGRVGGGKS